MSTTAGADEGGPDRRVEVVIPVHDDEDRIAATVAAARALPGVARVVVVDDGSTDASAARAAGAGAHVVRLAANRGKAGAVRVGVAACPDAEIVLLLDADLGSTAAEGERLLAPVRADEADMAIGVLPGAGRQGGFGLVRRLSAAGVRRACGFEPRAPLSGQRAVRRPLLDGLGPVERFGLEVALTVDAVRSGARVVEVDVAMDHAHTGRRLAGFRHRARQGSDIARALWPRLTTARTRIGLVVAAAIVAVLASLVLSPGADAGVPLDPVDQVVVVGVPRLGLDDLDRMPTLDALAREGALAATNVRTGGNAPRPVAAYATLSAGVRVDGVPAAATLERSDDAIAVPAMAEARAGAGRDVASEPGALGAALHEAGLATAVVTPESVATPGGPIPTGAAALAVADAEGRIDGGTVDRASLTGITGASEPLRVAQAVTAALEEADVVVVDPGDTTRATETAGPGDEAARRAALRRTDDTLARVVEDLPEGTLLLVVGVTPPGEEWRLTPTVAWGAGFPGHRLASPTTRRSDLVTLSDVGPTVLGALDLDVPTAMGGATLRVADGTVDRGSLERRDDVAAGREATYFRMTITFIVVQCLVQLGTYLLLARGRLRPGAARVVRGLTVVLAAWPLATYLVRMVPSLMTLGPLTHLAPWPVMALVGWVASRFRRHPLAPFGLVCGATAALIVADLATGGRLQVSSVLGTAPHTTYRFTGLGNAGFAVLAASALVAVGIHVDAAPRRREALATAACALAVVVVADVAPWMGADVGGILTLLPVSALTLLALSGRRLRARTLLLAAGLTVVGLAVVLGIDLLRPPEARTHLARFVTDTLADGDLGPTLRRRWTANTRMLTQSAWTWFVLPLAVAFAWAVARSPRVRARVPLGPSTRIGVLAALAAGVFGWLLNDSGVVVTALVLIFVPGVLTVAAMERLQGHPGPVPPAHPARAGEAGP